MRLMCVIWGGPELVRVPSIHPVGIKGSERRVHWLPLHFNVASTALRYCSPVSEFADFFRLMLSWYPEAAGVEGI